MWSLPAPDGDEVVVKLAPPPAVAREAAALARMAGTGTAPALLAHGAGVLVTARVPGTTRAAHTLAGADLHALGALLRRVHDACPADAGAHDDWDAPEATLHGYRRRRASDIAGAGAPPPPSAGAADSPEPFRALHGDLWSGNVVWSPDGPVLTDWEYHRAGDPAEEIAYMAAMDDLAPSAVDALLDGYGAPGLAGAVRWWRPLLAAECADWYAAEGDRERAAALRGRAARTDAR